MGTYAIGDLQGCYTEFLELLEVIGFDPRCDTLWLVGDLVNRGPESAATLRHVYSLRDNVVTVLGNHDILLLAAATADDPKKVLGPKDNLDDVLVAPDRDELLDWLRHRPLLHHDPGLDFVMVHAGFPPQWSLNDAKRLAIEVESVLRGPQYNEFFSHMNGDQPDFWTEELGGWDRLRFILNALTNMRFVSRDGRIDIHHMGPPGSQPEGLEPWYEVPRRSANAGILFGHWAALFANHPLSEEHPLCPVRDVFHLDTACYQGSARGKQGKLTALRLEDLTIFSVPSRQ